MTPAEDFDDALEAVYGLHTYRGVRTAFDWRAQVAQLERALEAARALLAAAEARERETP